MRNLKAFGLALVAVFAMGAIASSAASANQFHSAATNTTWTVASNSTQTYKYQSAGKTVECTTVGGSGTTTAQTVTEVTFSPTYSGCTVNGIAGSSAEVSMNGCDFKWTIEISIFFGAAHIQGCGLSVTKITIKVFGVSICTLKIGAQTPSGGDDYANSGSTKIALQETQTGITGSREGSTECGAATSTTGSFTGQMQLKGEETGQQNEKAIQVG